MILLDPHGFSSVSIKIEVNTGNKMAKSEEGFLLLRRRLVWPPRVVKGHQE